MGHQNAQPLEVRELATSLTFFTNPNEAGHPRVAGPNQCVAGERLEDLILQSWLHSPHAPALNAKFPRGLTLSILHKNASTTPEIAIESSASRAMEALEFISRPNFPREPGSPIYVSDTCFIWGGASPEPPFSLEDRFDQWRSLSLSIAYDIHSDVLLCGDGGTFIDIDGRGPVAVASSPPVPEGDVHSHWSILIGRLRRLDESGDMRRAQAEEVLTLPSIQAALTNISIDLASENLRITRLERIRAVPIDEFSKAFAEIAEAMEEHGDAAIRQLLQSYLAHIHDALHAKNEPGETGNAHFGSLDKNKAFARALNAVLTSSGARLKTKWGLATLTATKQSRGREEGRFRFSTSNGTQGSFPDLPELTVSSELIQISGAT